MSRLSRLQLVQKCVDELEELQMSQLNTSTFASISHVGGGSSSDVDGSRASAMISNAELVKRQIKGMAYHLDFLLYRKKSASSSSILRNAHECVESLDMHELSEATLRSLFDPLTPFLWARMLERYPMNLLLEVPLLACI